MPAESYTQHELTQSFRFLFRSGNRPRPPASFVDHAEFLEFLDGMNLRAALAVWDVKLYCRDGRPEAIVCRHEERVGYTPFVVGRTIHYSMGDGSERYAVEYSQDRAVIRQAIRFKIGKLGNAMARLMVGEWAPSAWMQIDYAFSCNGRIRIDFCGSFIPSQRYYRDWSHSGSFDMLTNSADDIDRFLYAGGCRDAPGHLHHSWSGNGQAC